jgi:hypothetical protein
MIGNSWWIRSIPLLSFGEASGRKLTFHAKLKVFDGVNEI